MVLICKVFYAFLNVKILIKLQIKSTDCAFTLAIHAEKCTNKYTENAIFVETNYTWHCTDQNLAQSIVWQ